MKRFLVLLAVIFGAVTAAWFTAKIHESHRRQADKERAHNFEPAPGRVEFVSLDRLISEPKKFSGKRLITAGVWSTGWERSTLAAENDANSFEISVDIDWSKVDEPMGDLSQRRKDEPKFGDFSRRIVAEGTFFYNESFVPNKSFLIDRLYRCEFVAEKEKTAQKSAATGVAN